MNPTNERAPRLPKAPSTPPTISAAASAAEGDGATDAVDPQEGEGARGSAAQRPAGHRWEASFNPDIVRPIVVTLTAAACIAGSAAGVGAFGGPSIRDAAGGLFQPDATLLAPSTRAFSIWSLIYAGLVAYTLYQWLPSQRRSERQRRLGWSVAASMVLNLAWILSARESLPVLSVVVIVLLLAVLLSALATLNRFPAESRWSGAFVDAPLGLYLGWVLVATAANIAAVTTAEGIDVFGLGGQTWALIGIAVVTLGAAVICMTDRGRIAVALAVCWGLAWILVERLLGEPSSMPVAFSAGLAAFLLLISAGSRRHQVDHNRRRRLRALQDAQREPLILDEGGN